MALPGGRRQSSRQVRTSTTRPHNYYARPFSSQPVDLVSAADAEPSFFPAITHFTDAADALPREVMRHFTMMKEVEAKLHASEEELSKLADQISKVPSSSKPAYDASVANNGVHGNGPNGVEKSESGTGDEVTKTGDDADLERTQMYRQLNYTIAVMAPMLDEKIAVLSTANMTLARQLERMESSYAHIPEEVSDEARLGSTTHWAYTAEKETKKAGAERTRREVAATNNLAAAAAAVHDQDVAAARSEARREAVLARKIRNQHIDSDFEDRPAPRRPYGKNRKQAEANNAIDPKSVGLGIAGGSAVPTKRKKTAATASTMERSISGVMAGRIRGIGSPTPGTESGRKRKNPPGPVPAKKRYLQVIAVLVPLLTFHRMQVGGAQSPRLVSSPLIGSFSAKDIGPKPPSARGRQNSQSSMMHGAPGDNGKARPQSSASNKPVNGLGVATTVAAITEQMQPKPSVETLPGPVEVQTALEPPSAVAKAQSDRGSPLKREDIDEAEDVPMPDGDQIVPTTIITRVGRRVSKTATPVMGSFPDIPARAGGRGSRAKDATGGPGSHASSESGHGAVPGERLATLDKRRRNGAAKESALEARKAVDVDTPADRSDNGEEADGEDDADEGEENEPRYCYCNEVSYGEMVACDNENCPREWFHLRCAGLREAPGEDCEFLPD